MTDEPKMVGWLDEAGAMNLTNLRITKRVELKDTADIEALPPETVFRTSNGNVGKVITTEYGRYVQWTDTDVLDELPRDYFYPLPDLYFPAEVIWSPDA